MELLNDWLFQGVKLRASGRRGATQPLRLQRALEKPWGVGGI